MHLTAALHYPWIDIQNINWLKKVVLYWNDIYTIVPSELEHPYQSHEAQALQYEGILHPLHVQPSTPEVQQASDDFGNFINTPEGRYTLRKDQRYGHLHPTKLSDELFRELLLSGQIQQNREGWLYTPERMANYYMILLASHISQNRRLSPIADSDIYSSLVSRVQRGDNLAGFTPKREYVRQTLMSELLINVISILPQTSIEELILFRRRHTDELALFRGKLEEITNLLHENFNSVEDFQQTLKDCIEGEIIPAQNQIRKALDRMRIRHTVEGITACIFCTPSFLLAENTLQPLIGQYSPLGAVGVAGLVLLITRRMLYRLDREEQVNENPYSYVYHANHHFRRKWFKRIVN